MSTNTRRMLALAGLSLALTACGGSSAKSPPAVAGSAASSSAPASVATSSNTSSGSHPNPCTLLTTAQISAALGSPVGTPKRTTGPQSGGTADSCSFTSTKVTGEAFQIFLFYPYAPAKFATDYKAANGYHPISGVGDMAVALQQRTELDAVKGSTLLTITYNVLNANGIASVAPDTQLQQLGEAATSKL